MSEKQAIFNMLGGRVKFHRGIYNPTADAAFLAAFIKPTNTILDVGIGTGGASLCLQARLPDVKITGIDTMAQMLKECAENAKLNNCAPELILGDIFTWKTARTFDAVMTNPPYFNGTPALHGAHHGVNLTDWTNKCVSRVAPRGYFYCIIDTLALAEIVSALSVKCGDITILPLFSKKSTAERVIIRARLGVKTGTTLYNGVSMNCDAVLRDGLTIADALFKLGIKC